MIHTLVMIAGYAVLVSLALAFLGLLSAAWDRISGGWWGPL